MLSKEQTLEWLEHPVTLTLRDFFKKELEDIVGTPTLDCLVWGEPQKSQENLIDLEARERTMTEMVAFLDGDFDELGESSE